MLETISTLLNLRWTKQVIPRQSSRRRALIVDPFFGELGGGKVVTLWMIETLKSDYDISVFCWYPFDLASFNRFAGTSLLEGEVKFLQPNHLLKCIGEYLYRLDSDDFSIQRWAIMLRVLKAIAPLFDVVISSRDETDFGRRGIQYIHFPYLAPHVTLQHSGEDVKATTKLSQRFRPWRLISGFEYESMRNNLTLTNSSWTSRLLEDSYAIQPEVLFPPIPGSFPRVPWDERDDMVICVGRLSPDKRIENIIEIVAALREQHPSFGLRIAGVPSPDPGGPEELQKLRALAGQHSWVEIHTDLSREDLISLISRSKIGLHAKIDEHFGIAVGEMLRGGCAVVVHNSGGQVEILGHNPHLLYATEAEAAQKIHRILVDAEHRLSIVEFLRHQAERFSVDHFQQRFREIVDGLFAKT